MVEGILNFKTTHLPSDPDTVQGESPTPIAVNSRREKALARWRDPETRAYLMQRYHSPEADKKRANSKRRWWQEHPEEKALLSLRGRERGRERWIESKMLELGELAADQGTDTKTMLWELYRERGLSMCKIGEILGFGAGKVSLLLKKMGVIDPNDRLVSRVKNPDRRLVDLVHRSVERGTISFITPSERTVLERRFLFDGGRRPSLRELTSLVIPGRNLSMEWVRQLEINGLVKLEVLDGDESRADRLTPCCLNGLVRYREHLLELRGADHKLSTPTSEYSC